MNFLLEPFTWYQTRNDMDRRIRVIENLASRLVYLSEEELKSREQIKTKRRGDFATVPIERLSPRALAILEELKN